MHNAKHLKVKFTQSKPMCDDVWDDNMGGLLDDKIYRVHYISGSTPVPHLAVFCLDWRVTWEEWKEAEKYSPST